MRLVTPPSPQCRNVEKDFIPILRPAGNLIFSLTSRNFKCDDVVPFYLTSLDSRSNGSQNFFRSDIDGY